MKRLARIGLTTPPCGIARLRSIIVPSSCTIGAVSHLEQRPCARHMFPDGPKQKLVVDIVEQSLDVELQNAIVLPAPLSRHAYGIESRFTGSVAVRICQKDCVESRLNQLSDNRLCHAVCHSGHPEDPLAPHSSLEWRRREQAAGSKRLSSFDSKSCRDCSSSRTRTAQSSLRRHRLRHH